MRNDRMRILQLIVLVALIFTLAAPSNAETGSVSIAFAKAGFIVGLGEGRGNPDRSWASVSVQHLRSGRRIYHGSIDQSAGRKSHKSARPQRYCRQLRRDVGRRCDCRWCQRRAATERKRRYLAAAQRKGRRRGIGRNRPSAGHPGIRRHRAVSWTIIRAALPFAMFDLDQGDG